MQLIFLGFFYVPLQLPWLWCCVICITLHPECVIIGYNVCKILHLGKTTDFGEVCVISWLMQTSQITVYWRIPLPINISVRVGYNMLFLQHLNATITFAHACYQAAASSKLAVLLHWESSFFISTIKKMDNLQISCEGNFKNINLCSVSAVHFEA